MSATSDLAQQLREMIQRARAESKWLWCRYQGLWFSPNALEEQNRNGKFLWGPMNWELRDPAERIEEAKARRDAAQKEVDRVIDEVVRAAR